MLNQPSPDQKTRMLETMALGIKVKEALIRKGLTRGRTKCPVCGGWVTGILAGKKNHLHMSCETQGCLWMME